MPADSYTRGVLAFSQGRLDEARQLFQAALEADETDYKAMFFLAWCMRIGGDRFISSQLLSVGVELATALQDEGFRRMYRAEMDVTR